MVVTCLLGMRIPVGPVSEQNPVLSVKIGDMGIPYVPRPSSFARLDSRGRLSLHNLAMKTWR
jgi:hypothetical protein